MNRRVCALLWCILALVLAGCGGSAVRPLQERQGEAARQEVQVLVVDLEGVMGTVEIALCTRALREAASRGMSVVFRMSTAGGEAESSSEIYGLLDLLDEVRSKVGTTALLNGRTQGGAAYLALLCDQLYFLRDGEIGPVAAMPTTWEMIQELGDESAERQRQRAYADELLARLERRKTKLSPDARKLCEGMADLSMQLVRATLRERGMESTRIVSAQELGALQAAGATVIDQQKVTQPVVLDQRDAADVGISRGVVRSMEQLCTDVLLVDTQLVGELKRSWAEDMVGWLELLQPALLILGFVLLVLEIKTPGLGLPGILGTAFLALAMFYSYLVGLADVAEIILFFLGIILIGVEIFVLPGMVVFGAAGFLCLVLSLILSRQTFVLPSNVSEQEILFYNLLHLIGLFAAVIVTAAVLWRVLPYIPIVNKLYLAAPEPNVQTGRGAEPIRSPGADQRRAAVGSVGTAATVLRPAGVMEIDGQRIDVVTNGEYLDIGQRVRVIDVVGNRVIVESVAGDAGGAPTGAPTGAEDGSVGVILLLMACGLIFLVAEIFFVSFGVLAALSGGSIIGAVFLAFQEGPVWGWTVLITEAFLAPAAAWGAFRILPKTPFGRALMLEGPRPEEVTGGAMSASLRALLDKTGETLSALRPTGFARIEGRKVDVVTRGEMIDAGSRVRVVEVLGNRVVVKAEPPER